MSVAAFFLLCAQSSLVNVADVLRSAVSCNHSHRIAYRHIIISWRTLHGQLHYGSHSDTGQYNGLFDPSLHQHLDGGPTVKYA